MGKNHCDQSLLHCILSYRLTTRCHPLWIYRQQCCVATHPSKHHCCRLKSVWDTYAGNFSLTEGEDRHGPSQIPTDVDLPHKTFGSQLVDDSPFERPDVLPFSTYAACRILDTNPEDIVSCPPVIHMLNMS